ncbi:MAG: helix-turn-helix domain-containing protein [Bacteroidales bacterium]|nr:helix-turn-helix domain-containing protein [Bacteroidales bacterium]
MEKSFILVETNAMDTVLNEISQLKEIVMNITENKQDSGSICGYINREEAAKHLNIGTTSFDKYVNSGDIPYRYIGKRKMYLPKELDEYTEKHRKVKIKF